MLHLTYYFNYQSRVVIKYHPINNFIMIPIFEKMDLNKFKKVYIPKTKNLLARYGFRYTNNGSSTVEDADFINSSRNKLDQIQAVNNELYQRYSAEMAERERSKQTQQQSENIVEE